MQTAEATVKSNAAQQFKDAVEMLRHQSEIVQTGGIMALGFLARDYPEYQEAVYVIIDERATQMGG